MYFQSHPLLSGGLADLRLMLVALALYFIITPLIHHILENIMENGAFAPMEHFKYSKLYLKFSLFFSMLSKNRNIMI